MYTDICVEKYKVKSSPLPKITVSFGLSFSKDLSSRFPAFSDQRYKIFKFSMDGLPEGTGV